MDLYTGADSVRAYLSGAASDGAHQGSCAASLGGYRSNVVVESLTPRRYSPIAGIVLTFVAGANGTGLGTLRADTADSLRWAAPGGVEGVSVAIADGETKAIPGEGDDADKYIVVSRSGAIGLAGTEVVQLLDTYRTVVGGSDFTAAEQAAGEEKYRGIFFLNASSAGITGLTVWIDPDTAGHTRIAKEAPAGGALQVMANEYAQPTGLTWVYPTTEGTGIVIGDLAAGSAYGFRIEQFIAASAPAGARERTRIRYSFTADDVKHYGELRGLHRVADAALERVELFVGTDAKPDLDGAADATAAITGYDADGIPQFAPFTNALAAGHVYHCAVIHRNRFGLASLIRSFEVISVNDDGSLGYEAPSTPISVAAKAGAQGVALVSATYDPAGDAHPATAWVVYERTNGTDPVKGVDTPKIVAMGTGGGTQVLQYTSASNVDATPYRYLVLTRRVDGEVNRDSSNTAIVSVTGSWDGPVRPDGRVTLGRAAGILQGPPAFDGAAVVYVDEAKNIRWVQSAGSVYFYAGAELIWRAIYNGEGDARNGLYFPSDWDLWADTVGGAGAADPVEVGTWDPSPKVIYVVTADGVRQMKIDVTNKRITYVEMDQVSAAIESRYPAPAWPRYDAACFQLFDGAGGGWVTYMSVDKSGVWRRKLDYDQRFSQVQIEGL